MSKMKAIALTSVLAASVVASAGALADASGNIGVVSNYVWRGLTQTDNGSAIQGGLDYSHPSGLSVGTWVSNTAFGSQELDIYGAYNGTVGEFGYTISAIQYRYPSLTDANWSEIALGGSYKNFSVKYSTTSKYANLDSKANYIEAAASFELKKDLSLGLHVGHQNFNDEAAVGLPSYSDYSVSLSKGDFAFTISNTNISQADDPADSDPKYFVSWSKSFDL